jgi:SAM-dependent methyltransferase
MRCNLDSLFYKAFEEKYRGSRELIKNRLRVYLDIIKPLKDIYPEPNAIDLGCGRGEWLELIGELGFKAHGVDIDDGMLEDCRKNNLTYTKQDALEYLKILPDESHTIITAFHLAEHLSYEVLLRLTSEAKRVLKPCGLLIMETPNPENIFVGINNFYLDPTHIRPLPIGLLSFITECAGFSRIKVLRLQENKELLNNENLKIMDIINGVSPDYAVLAQKDGLQESLTLFEDAFSKDYGLSLLDLGEAYEKNKAATINKLYITTESQSQQLESQSQQLESQSQQLESQSQQLESQSQQLESQSQQLESQSQQLESQSQQLESQSQQLESQSQQLESQSQQLESQSQQLESQSQQLLHLRRVIQLVKLVKWLIKLPTRSMKWFIRRTKITLRKCYKWGLKLLNKIAARVMGITKIVLKKFLGIPMKIVYIIKPLKRLGDWVLKPFPKLRGRIKSFILSSALISPANNTLYSEFAEPEEEKYIPQKLRVGSMVEKDANKNAINEILLKTRYEYEKEKNWRTNRQPFLMWRWRKSGWIYKVYVTTRMPSQGWDVQRETDPPG